MRLGTKRVRATMAHGKPADESFHHSVYVILLY